MSKMLAKASANICLCPIWHSSPEYTWESRVQYFVLPLSLPHHSPLSHVNETLISAALIDNHGNGGKPNEAEVQVKICLHASTTHTINSLNKHPRYGFSPSITHTGSYKQQTMQAEHSKKNIHWKHESGRGRWHQNEGQHLKPQTHMQILHAYTYALLAPVTLSLSLNALLYEQDTIEKLALFFFNVCILRI